MDFTELVNQIAAKVAERISELGENVVVELPDYNEISKRPKLLILSEAHGTACHELWENEDIIQKYDMTCALHNENQCNVQHFDVILLRNLSNVSLGKIAEGIGDTAFTELVIQAILLGKKIIIPNEEVEIFKYKDTAPKLYYGMMTQKIESLKNSGIIFCSIEQLESILLDKECELEKKKGETIFGKPAIAVMETSPQNAITIEKRVITERDIQNAYEQHANLICITEKTIITALARDCADKKSIAFKIC